jgi:anti-anti-sigma factor
MTTHEPPAACAPLSGAGPARIHRLPGPRAPSDEFLRSDLRWRSDDAIVVEVTGEIDSCTAVRLEEALGEQLRAGPGVLRVDLGAVHFLGTAGLSVLWRVRQEAEAAGIHLIVDPGGSRAAGRALDLLAQLDGVFPAA